MAARSAVLPLVREGDPTRTLIEATRPVHDRSRVRIAARNVALSLAWMCIAMYGLYLVDRRRRGAQVTAHGRARRGGHGPLRGGHRHRDPLPAQDGVEDVLRLLDRLRRRRAQHPRLPGLPRPARDAARDQPARGGVRDRHRPRDRGAHPRAHAVGAQELLLPRPAQGLPDQPVRDPARGARPAVDRDLGRPVRRQHHPGAPRGGHGQARPRRRRRRRWPPDHAGRLQPVRRAPDGDRDRARDPHGRAGPPLRGGAPAADARDRRERRRHGARPDARRGQRLAPAPGRGARSGRGSRSRT